MSVDIKLKLIKPSKDLRLACTAYSVISASFSNAQRLGLLSLVDLLRYTNKDLKIAIDYSRKYYDLIDKIVLEKKLDKDDKKVLRVLDKLFTININKKDEEIFNNYLLKFNNDLNKTTKILSELFTDTKVNLNVFCLSNIRYNWGGSATKKSFFLTIHDDIDISKINKKNVYCVIIHEMIHTINSNNDVYKRMILDFKNKNKPINQSSFNETFTKTIENVCMYKLGYNKNKFESYRFNSLKEKVLEDKIRKIYLSWEKTKKKDKFIQYFEKKFLI